MMSLIAAIRRRCHRLLRKLRPVGVFWSMDRGFTEVILADTFMVWRPHLPGVECAYDCHGCLVGIRIDGDIRYARKLKPITFTAVTPSDGDDGPDVELQSR